MTYRLIDAADGIKYMRNAGASTKDQIKHTISGHGRLMCLHKN